MGCGRSFHRLATIAKAADVLVDFTHDMHLHPLADMTAVGTHEQTVLYQTAKLRALPAYNADNLILKKKSLSVEYSTFGAVLIYFIYRYFKGFTVAVWVGSSGPALCSLGGW